MIFEVGLLCLAYYGSKKLPDDSPLAQKIRTLSDSTIAAIEDQVSVVRKAMAGAATDRKVSGAQTKSPQKPPEKAQKSAGEQHAEAVQSHYAHVSTLSLGALAVRKFVPLAGPVGFAAYIYGLAPHLRDVEDSLVNERRINCNSLFLFADILALLTGNYVAAALSLYMIQLGKLGVIRAKDDSRKQMQHLFLDLPGKVWVARDGSEIEVDLDSITSDEIIVLHGGNVIPVDGVIVDGCCGVNQQALTGEAQIAEKAVGDTVFANTLVTNGRILVRVERSGAETTSNQIADILFNSVSYKSKVQLKGERWADQLTAPTFYSALALLPFIGPVSTSVYINAHIGMRIRVFAPMVTLKHISMASKNGLLVKDGRALENFIAVDTVLFDKTGTLTHEDPDVTRIICLDRCSESELLRHAAIAEQKQTHPIARAILRKARQMGISVPEVDDSHYSIGYGIKVECDGKTIQVGSLRYLNDDSIVISDELNRIAQREQAAGHSIVFVAVNRRVLGALQLQPRTRAEMERVIARLRGQGIKYMAIVSGDHEGPTRALAEQLGMDGYFANVLPREKADIVERLQAQGKVVCFVGDGINDAIALKQSNVSISVAGASTIAQDVAEIVLMDGHLHAMNDLHDVSASLDRNLKKSLRFCIAPGVANLLGAFVLRYDTLVSLLVNCAFAIGGGISVAASSKLDKKPDDASDTPS